MKTYTILLQFLSTVNACPVSGLLQRRDTGTKSVQLSFNVSNSFTDDVSNTIKQINQKSMVYNNAVSALVDSDATVSDPLQVVINNQMNQYVATLEIGSNKQKVQVDIDTGSSDLWVPATGTKSSYGTFDKSTSTSYKKLADGFSISYNDKKYAKGEWGTDDIMLDEQISLKDFQFAVATNQTAAKPILGIGLKGLEMKTYITTNVQGEKVKVSGQTYNNFVLAMKLAGLIDHASFGLFLDSQTAKTGSILFGSSDSTKYNGDLTTFNVVKVDDSGNPVEGNPVAFFVDLGSIEDAQGNYFTKKAYPALLDSGTTLISAPKDVYEAVVAKYARFDSTLNGYYQDCDYKGPDLKFKFVNGVNGATTTITVGFSNLLYPLNGVTYNGKKQCLFGLTQGGNDIYMLGDAFLRSAYVYYDIENYQIGLAQANT